MKNKYQAIKQRWNKRPFHFDVTWTYLRLHSSLQGLRLSVLSSSKCTVTLCEQSSKINLRFFFKTCSFIQAAMQLWWLCWISSFAYMKRIIINQQKCYCRSWTIVHNYAKMKSNQLSFLYVIIFWSWCINWCFKRVLVTQRKIAVMLDEQ